MGGPEFVTSMDELERGQHLGDNNSQSTAQVFPPRNYHDKYIKPKLENRPWLDILHEFLDPNIEKFAVARMHRLWHFDVKVIHISSGGDITLIECESIAQFNQAISTADSEQSGTLIIAEDISAAVIDALGMQYGLEPEFFAYHLLGTESFRMGYWESPMVGSRVRAPNVPPNYLRSAPYYTADFRRPYNIPEGLKEAMRLRGTVTNTPRGAQILHRDMPDMFVYEKISIYKRKGSKFGVILTDKLLSDELAASYMLDVITLRKDGTDAPANSNGRKQTSSREELIGWLQFLAPAERRTLFHDHEPLALRPALGVIERCSTMFLAYVRYINSRIVTGHSDELFPDNISFSMHVSRSMHRYIHEQLRLLKVALRTTAVKGGEGFTEEIEDFRFLVEQMEGVLKALEEDVRYLVAAASIKEGKMVGWISKFAFLFLPASLLATILSLMDPGSLRWIILGALSVPFVLLSIFLMFFWKPSDIDSLKA